MAPVLSVVMPVYNTGSYLRPCLESVLGATHTDLELVVADDGSTDGSAALLDDFAARDPRMRVLHLTNGGPGRARNLAIEQARGRYLMFVDSDDRVPPDAFARLIATLERSGSDFATGRIQRFSDTRSWLLEQSRLAMPADAIGTHVTRSPALLYDTTDCNKMFRRAFWLDAGLRFLEGVVYEDVLPMVQAHLDARAVDVLAATVYHWRRRGGERSITQTQARIETLRDRMAAAEAVRDLLLERGLPDLARAQDEKELAIDLANGLPNLPEAGPEYRAYLAGEVRRVVDRAGADALDRLPVWTRVAYDLLCRDRPAEAAEVMTRRRAVGDDWPVRRAGRRYEADLPFRGDAAVGVPERLYDVTAELPLRHGIDGIAVDAGHLVLSGWAYLDKVPASRPWAAARWLQLRRGKSRRLIVRPLRPVRRAELTAGSRQPDVGYEWAGFRVRVRLGRLLPAGRAEATYDLALGLVDATGRRRVEPLTGAASPALEATWVHWSHHADGTYVALAGRVGAPARLTVLRAPAVAVAAEFAAGAEPAVTVGIRLPDPATGDERIAWTATGGAAETVTAPVEVETTDPHVVRIRLPLAAFAPQPADTPGQRTWRATVEHAGTTLAVVAAPDLPAPSTGVAGREIGLRVGAGGRLLLVDRLARAAVRDARLDRGELVVRLDSVLGPEALSPVLQHADGGEVTPTRVDAERSAVVARFRVLPEPDVSIRPGRWTLLPQAPGPFDDGPAAIEVDRRLCAAGPPEQHAGAATARLVATPRRLTVEVTCGEPAEQGRANQRRLRRTVRAATGSAPLRDQVLVVPRGRFGFDGDARALADELHRRGRRVMWVRAHTGVEQPPGLPWVLAGSAAHHEALTTSATILTDGPLPRWFTKRPGTRVIRTGLGTPIARLPGDRAEQWRADAAHWDLAVAGNPEVTAFLRDLGYPGRVIEAGAPRTDRLVAAATDPAGRSAARAHLGLHDEQRAVLWAPTWRPADLDVSGRVVLRLPFELGAWADVLGAGDVLLTRFHPLVTGAHAELHRGPALRNVTTYPDLGDLLLAADVLVTDYASLMTDFAVTDRPIVLYAWDAADFADSPGVRLDLAADGPGPLVTTAEQLAATLAALRTAPEERAGARTRFRAALCPHDDGTVAARVVAELG